MTNSDFHRSAESLHVPQPCPFCGSSDLTLTTDRNGWKVVECDDCGTVGPCIDLEGDQYIERWNRRIPDVAQSAKVTPAARWRANGEADPHGNQYDCERAGLAHGDMTDDEIANALFLKNYDIGIITAAKERIRWLSRALESALAARPPAAPVACPWCGFEDGRHHPWCRSPALPALPHNTVLQPSAAPVETAISSDGEPSNGKQPLMASRPAPPVPSDPQCSAATDYANGLKILSGLVTLTPEQSDFLHDAAEEFERIRAVPQGAGK